MEKQEQKACLTKPIMTIMIHVVKHVDIQTQQNSKNAYTQNAIIESYLHFCPKHAQPIAPTERLV